MHHPDPRPGDSLIVSWDTAMSSNQLADFSVCVVLLVRGETVYVLDVIRELVLNIPISNAQCCQTTDTGDRWLRSTVCSLKKKGLA